MKTNKLYNSIFIAVFLLLCLIPSLGILVFGTGAALSNETRTTAPKLIDREGHFNLSNAADWVGDHIAFRTYLIDAWSRLNSGILKSSVQDDVIIGSEGVLYFSSTINDYTGISLSDAELGMLTHDLSLIQEYTEAQGCEFLYTIAPNKLSVYSEALPKYYPDGRSSSNLAKLPALFKENNIPYADLLSTLAGRNEVLYYLTDTHWTSRGAALGADTILTAFGISSDYYSGSFDIETPHKGDLYDMLYPASGANETDLVYSGFCFEELSNAKNGEALRFSTSCTAGMGKLRCWRDSFGIALYPYLAQSFAEAEFLRSNSYDLTGLAENGVTHVLIELVERNQSYLLKNSPVLPAPVRDVLIPEAINAGTVDVSVSSKNGMLKLELHDIPAAPDSTIRVYITDGSTCYEAYLLYDSVLSASAYVPVDFEPQSVIVSTARETLSFKVSIQ